MPDYIKNLIQVDHSYVALVGGKGANLGEVIKAGLPVPPGFCITVAAYQSLIQHHAMARHIEQIEVCPFHELANKAREIADTIMSMEFPHDVANAIYTAFDSILEPRQFVSVRSSATAEDLPEASFAGQQESFLNVDRQGVLEYVKRCFASLWSDRAVHYRARQGFGHRRVYLAVVVQQMISAEISGVAFSVNPLSQDENEVMIDSAWGLGEGIVSGLITPDNFVLNKSTGKVIRQRIAAKTHMIATSDTSTGTAPTHTPTDRQMVSSLSVRQLSDLVKMVREVENHFGTPQDIEWAFAGNRFYLLQSRPITTLHSQVSDSTLSTPACFQFNPKWQWTNIGGLKERYNRPLSPLGWSIIEPWHTAALRWCFESIGAKIPSNVNLIANIHGFLFMNYTVLKNSLPVSALAPYLSEKDDQEFFPSRSRFQDMALSLKFFLRLRNLSLTLDTAFAEMLPAYLREVATRKKERLDELTRAELFRYIKDCQQLGLRFFRHQTANLIVSEGLFKMLSAVTTKWVGDKDLSLTANLVSGLPGNLTVATNNAVWDLAQELKESPDRANRLRNEPPHEFLAYLSQTEGENGLLSKLNHLLEEHGHVGPDMDVASDFWGEVPELVIYLMKGFLATTGDTNSAQRENDKRETREKAEAVVRARLSPMRRRLFNRLLSRTQAYMLLRDNRHYYVTMPLFLIKRATRLLAANLEHDGLLLAKDIYRLTLQEVEFLSTGKMLPKDAAQLIRIRKSFQTVQVEQLPPLFSGVPDLMVQESGGLPSGKVLQGGAGSSGRVSGPVRIIRSTEDFSRLQAGEILVATSTNPAWTPLFAVASGLIADYGGPLSHGAIVAREYGIPAVLGVKNATLLLRDGQIVTVDGSRGVVVL